VRNQKTINNIVLLAWEEEFLEKFLSITKHELLQTLREVLGII
jgi:hypothetical protein